MFVTYAQNFEDVMLWRALKHVERGFYVDVGANHPVIDSVSRAFYERGWRGVHVEPIPECAALLRAARPDEPVIEKAVGAEAGTRTLYVLTLTGLSSLFEENARRAAASQGCEPRELSVEVVTLDAILAPYAGRDIHWLMIDVEGAELDVLRGWNSQRDRPWLMVVEAMEPGTDTPAYADWEPLLIKAQYTFVYFDGLNRFYVANERRQLADAFASPPNVFDEAVSARLLEQISEKQFLAQRLEDGELRVSELDRRLGEVQDFAYEVEQRLISDLTYLISDLTYQTHRAEREMRRADEAESLLRTLSSSRSWRMTEPLRKAGLVARQYRSRIVKFWNKYRRTSAPSRNGPATLRNASSLAIPAAAASSTVPVALLAPRQGKALPAEIAATRTAPLSLEHVVTLNQMRQSLLSMCVVIPVTSASRAALERSIQSVLRQTDSAWELLLAPYPGHDAVAREWLDVDWRIRVINPGQTAPLLVAAAEFATGDFVGLLGQGDIVDDYLVRFLTQRVCREPDIDIVYTDEARELEDGTTGDPFYKPAWSPEHLDSVNYIGRFTAIRKSLLLDTPVATAASSPEAAEYALLLDATRRARKIAHIDEPLYVNAGGRERGIGGFFSTEALPEARNALERQARRENPCAKVSADPASGMLDVEWPVPSGMPITLVVLTGLARRELPGRGDTLLVANFVESIIHRSTFQNYKILVVDDGTLPRDLARLLADHGHKSRSFVQEGRFSFAKKANFGVSRAAAGIVLLLNDDLEVISPDWIQRLAGLAARDGVGVAGARLLFADGTIQHAGIAVGFHGSAGHIFHRAANDGREYAGFASVQRNFSAVTGAVMAFRKELFERLGGFDERFAIDYNDVDFCLRCIEAGYRVVQAPAATLYHFHNSSIRRPGDGSREPGDGSREVEIFRSRWSAVIDRDPFYSKHFQKRHNDLPILDGAAGAHSNAPESMVEHKLLSRKAYEELLADLERKAADIATTDFTANALQVRAFMRLGLFDRAYYLATYPDVGALRIDPLAHYVLWGDAEGRWPNSMFDPIFYRKQIGQERLANMLALYHYAAKGEAAGHAASASFNPRRYLESNPEIAAWVDHPLTHYLWLGRPAGLNANRRARLDANENVTVQRRCQPKKVDTTRLSRAVNIIGPLDRISGLGVSARGYLDALRSVGCGPVGAQVETREFGIQAALQGEAEFPPFIADAAVNVVHMNGDTLPPMLERGTTALFENRYNVAVWFWELATIRPEWHDGAGLFHEFWAPSPFIARTIRRCTTKPVRLIPPYLSHLRRMTPGLRDPSYPNFVYCFDANSVVERKNPGALLDAFRQAFPIGSDARLTFKITYSNRQIAAVDKLYAAREADPRIVIIDDILSDMDLHALIASATAYVSPHRSEGLGLTIIEAMGSLVPVIATPYGGIDEFVTPDVAYPIDYRLIELAANYPPYPKGFVWADPDVESLARLLRDVVERPAVASARALEARARVLDFFASARLIETFRGELDRILSGLFDDDRNHRSW